jgi:hypothetical protein
MSPYKNIEEAKRQKHQYYVANKDAIRVQVREKYQSDDKFRAKTLARKRNWRLQHALSLSCNPSGTQGKRRVRRTKENPFKAQARMLAATHIPFEAKCAICGSTVSLQRHHSDYSNPLQVQTHCRKCHTLVHFKERNNELAAKINTFFPQRLGYREIARRLGISRHRVTNICKVFGITWIRKRKA